MDDEERLAWGITGAGDQIRQVKDSIDKIKDKFSVKIDVFVSKAGEKVLKMYNIFDEVKKSHENFSVEVDSNTPFLAGSVYTGKYKGLLIAPATSNTVAKISNCIGDSLLTNATLQALKAYKPVFLMPTDLKAGQFDTVLPNGEEIKVRVREEDAQHVEILRGVDGVRIIEGPEEIGEAVRSIIDGK